MTVARLIDRALWGWTVWRMRRQRERAYPELKLLRLEQQACRKRHRAGAKAAEKAAQAMMHANMAGRA